MDDAHETTYTKIQSNEKVGLSVELVMMVPNPISACWFRLVQLKITFYISNFDIRVMSAVDELIWQTASHKMAFILGQSSWIILIALSFMCPRAPQIARRNWSGTDEMNSKLITWLLLHSWLHSWLHSRLHMVDLFFFLNSSNDGFINHFIQRFSNH